MAEILFNEIKYTLSSLLDEIDIGDIGLPEIQRQFIWSNTKVRDLFDSMYKGFPVGYLLFWVNGIGEKHKQIGTDKKQKIARLLIVDGQQRLTSLYAVIKGIPILRENYKTERIYIALIHLRKNLKLQMLRLEKIPNLYLILAVSGQKKLMNINL